MKPNTLILTIALLLIGCGKSPETAHKLPGGYPQWYATASGNLIYGTLYEFQPERSVVPTEREVGIENARDLARLHVDFVADATLEEER
ncbi:MAG: hypothetical protein JNJ45_05405 [Chthonomonas sp.]|nr:hypothetical protein [Chthonomonas sp.]